MYLKFVFLQLVVFIIAKSKTKEDGGIRWRKCPLGLVVKYNFVIFKTQIYNLPIFVYSSADIHQTDTLANVKYYFLFL